ncbi:MAG: MMPL family transporter [Stenotrophomonas koreensis]
MPGGRLLKRSSTLRSALALLWLALLALLGWWLSTQIQVSGDLRKFMPEPRTAEQSLLIDELGDGPGSRLLMLALQGDATPVLAAQSRQLATRLREDDRFDWVLNGDQPMALEDLPEHLLPYRYLLAPVPAGQFEPGNLQLALQDRLADLASPMGEQLEPLLPRDPTLHLLALLEQQPRTPPVIEGVWFTPDADQALLLVQTRNAGFDPSGQQQAVDAITTAFAAVSAGSTAQLEMTGPGAFAVKIGNQTSGEARLIGTIDSIGLVLLLLLVYRGWKYPLLGFLPLASAGLAGLCAVVIGFEGVHGITIAFGFTLIGVVQDYPIHFFSHQRPGLSPWANVRALWPTLGTGVVATCIAYLTFLFSGVDGLRQLAVFTITALLTAALATRYLLPALVDPASRDMADQAWLQRLWRGIEGLPRPRRSLGLLAALAIAVVVLAPGAFWQNDLSRLTPVAEADLQRDGELRNALGAPDVRYLVTVAGSDTEQALARSQALLPLLQQQVDQGGLVSFDMAARWLPSAATQRERQAQLPDAATLQASLARAVADTPFRADAFAPFLADVQTARQAVPLTVADLQGTPLAGAVESLLLHRPGKTLALVTLTGVEQPQALAAALAGTGATWVDLKQASESLVAAWRVRVLAALAVALLLLTATVWFALRDWRRVWRVLLPMLLTTVLVLAVLRGLGVELNLFHLIGLILAAGLGLDYGLFFEHAGDQRAAQLRTLHGLLVCSAMTLLVFSLLATSSIPVLRAIGSTVALGVACNFVLALLVSRHAHQPEGKESMHAH